MTPHPLVALTAEARRLEPSIRGLSQRAARALETETSPADLVENAPGRKLIESLQALGSHIYGATSSLPEMPAWAEPIPGMPL